MSGDYVLMIGGWDVSPGSYSRSVYAYYYYGQDWWYGTSMSVSRQSLVAVTLSNGIAYAIGGLNTGGASRVVEAYNSNTDTWTTKANTLYARDDGMAAVVNDKIYYMGGYNSGTYLALVEEYEPLRDT